MAGELHSLIASQQPAAAAAALYTIGLDGHRTLCLRWQGPFSSAEDLNEAVEERALRQANALGGTHNFMFELSAADGSSLGSEVFRVNAEAFTGERSMLSEPANEGGVLAMTMRMLEAAMRINVQQSKGTHDALLKQNQVLAHRADQSESRYLQGMEVFLSSITGQRQAEVDAIRADGNARAKLAIANRVGALLGPLAAGFLKKQLPGAAGASLGAAANMQGLAATLSAEQMEKIMGVLSPEQNAQLFALLAPLKADEEEHEVQPAQPRKVPNGDARH